MNGILDVIFGRMASNTELIRILADLGGTVLIAAIILYLVYKIINQFCLAMINSMQQIANAMGDNARCVMEMKTDVAEYVQRDNSDHREFLLTLQVFGKQMEVLTKEIRGNKKWTSDPKNETESES